MPDRCRIGVLVPFQGTGGIFGPSCSAAAEHAKSELNSRTGIGGREVELVYIDAGQPDDAIVSDVARLIGNNGIDALTGWHISSIRKQLVPIVQNRIPYVYTSLSEGDAQIPGIYLMGENPEQQIFPALKWMRKHLGFRKWHVVGAKYVWPVRSLQKTAEAAISLDLEIVGSTFVEMGNGGSPILPRAVAESGCDGVIMFLVGQDAVDFNRNFAQLGLHQKIARFSPLMEENMLLASGTESTEQLFSSASYFRTLTSKPALEFLGQYVSAYGDGAPALNNMAQSCYQGIYTLAELGNRSRSFSIADFEKNISSFSLEGPRGLMTFKDNQAIQSVHIAQADGFDFDVLETLIPVVN